MAFVLFKPKRPFDGAKDKLSIRIPKVNKRGSVDVVIAIGSGIAELLNLSAGERVAIYFDDSNPKKWMLEKSKTDGHKIVKNNCSQFRVQLSIKIPDLNITEKMASCDTPYLVRDGKVFFDLPINNMQDN